MLTGWISIHRKIQNHELWQDKPFSRGQAWIDILLMVNYQDEKVFFDGGIIEVKRGSRITSIRKLCSRWGWSNTKVIRFLTMLEHEKMLSLNSDKKKTVLTVENYDLYQNEKLQKRHRNDTETTLKHTNNKDNKDNNIKDIYIGLSAELKQALLDFEKMRKIIKAPLTDRAKKMLLTELNKLACTEKEKIEILEQSILNNWKSVYPLKKGGSENGSGRKPNEENKKPSKLIEKFGFKSNPDGDYSTEGLI